MLRLGWWWEIEVELLTGVGVGVQFLGQIAGIGLLLRKNRIENGRRADPSGSKPHS